MPSAAVSFACSRIPGSGRSVPMVSCRVPFALARVVRPQASHPVQPPPVAVAAAGPRRCTHYSTLDRSTGKTGIRSVSSGLPVKKLNLDHCEAYEKTKKREEKLQGKFNKAASQLTPLEGQSDGRAQRVLEPFSQRKRVTVFAQQRSLTARMDRRERPQQIRGSIGRRCRCERKEKRVSRTTRLAKRDGRRGEGEDARRLAVLMGSDWHA